MSMSMSTLLCRVIPLCWTRFMLDSIARTFCLFFPFTFPNFEFEQREEVLSGVFVCVNCKLAWVTLEKLAARIARP